MKRPDSGRRYLAHMVCRALGISKKTLFRWEAAGLIPTIKRDWRQWRVYTDTDIAAIRRVMQRGKQSGKRR